MVVLFNGIMCVFCSKEAMGRNSMANDYRSILQEIESIARGNNNRITYKDVMSIIESNDVEPEIAEKIFDSLEAKSIEILPETNVEEESLNEVDLNAGFGEGVGLDLSLIHI